LVQQDSARALAAADEVLKTKPQDQGMRLLKAIALSQLENREAEAIKLLRELSKEDFAPAVYRLAYSLGISEDENEKKEAITFYEQYVRLEPYDPRGLHELAAAYDGASDFVKAESTYRKFLDLDPGNSIGYSDLVTFLVMRNRLGEAGPVLVAAEKNVGADRDVFGAVMIDLADLDDSTYAIKFAASQPERMKTSSDANLALGRMYTYSGKYALALPLLHTTMKLDNEWDEPYLVLALLHRKQSRFAAALQAADQAIKLDEEDSDGYYERACALARLGRIKEAMSSLEKAVELLPERAEWMASEKDLKPLANLPAFKKLLPPPEKP
jgi:Flp pilus assembly protein TadD